MTVSTSKPDHVDELLEATRKMTRYFKKSYRQNRSHHSTTDTQYLSTNNNNAINLNKHKHRSCNTNDQVNEIVSQICTSKNIKSDPEDIKDPHDSDSPESNCDSSSDSE